MSNESETQNAVQLAILKTKVENLDDILRDYIGRQDTLNKRHQEKLDYLVDMAARGKGSIWILMALGGAVTVLLSNIPIIKKLFS